MFSVSLRSSCFVSAVQGAREGAKEKQKRKEKKKKRKESKGERPSLTPFIFLFSPAPLPHPLNFFAPTPARSFRAPLALVERKRLRRFLVWKGLFRSPSWLGRQPQTVTGIGMKLCIKENFVHIKNTWKEQFCKLKVWDFIMAFWVVVANPPSIACVEKVIFHESPHFRLFSCRLGWIASRYPGNLESNGNRTCVCTESQNVLILFVYINQSWHCKYHTTSVIN